MKTRSIQSIRKGNVAASVYGSNASAVVNPIKLPKASMQAPKTLTIHDNLSSITSRLQNIANDLDTTHHHTIGSDGDDVIAGLPAVDAPAPQCTVRYQIQIINEQLTKIEAFAVALRNAIGTPNPAQV